MVVDADACQLAIDEHVTTIAADAMAQLRKRRRPVNPFFELGRSIDGT